MKMRHLLLLLLICCLLQISPVEMQGVERRIGNFREVFAWRQLTYNINGNLVLQDRFSENDVDDTKERDKRETDSIIFNNNDNDRTNWNNPNQGNGQGQQHWPSWGANRPWATSSGRPNSSTAATNEDAGRFFIQYNNLPMGVERVGNRLFVTVPRRRYGIPSTLNYINLDENRNTRSPALSPYPSLRDAGLLTSVYRTRADECGRLWMVDTGLLEIPNNPQQVRPPAIVIFDLESNTQILRYELNGDLLPAANTPTGLASITVDVTNGDCAGAYAYIPDLTTYGIIVFSLRDNDSWRLSHNYFHFNPTAGNLRIAGQRFQWSDGIFSITLTEATSNGCKVAYFHPMVSTQEFSVSTCVLKNRTASSDSDYWSLYSVVGDRGESSQSTMHGYHAGSKTIFFADISRNAISCWNTALPLMSTNVAILAQDTLRISYPSDLHVTGDEVWVMANSLPRWGYSRLDTNEYNFYIYRGSVRDLITGTTCAGTSSYGMG